MQELKNHIAFEAGTGKSIIFLHGIEEDGSFWFPIDRAVSECRQVITIDLLGYGQSPKNSSLTYTKKEHVEALLATLQAGKINQKVTLVGHSMGCYIALGFAAVYPELVEKVILISPVVILKDTDIKKEDLTDAMKEGMLESVGAIRDFLNKVAASTRTKPEVAQSLNNFASSTENIHKLVEEQDMPGDFEKIGTIPVEIVYGAIDPLVVPENLKYLAERYHNVTLIDLPAGHDPVHQQSEAVFKLIVPSAKSVPAVTYQRLWRK